MWIFTKDSFLSIAREKGDRRLMVRARFAEDILLVYPHAKIVATPDRDYPFRAYMTPKAAAKGMAEEVESIYYAKFKPEVKQSKRHTAYMDVWSVMYDWQTSVTGKPGIFGMGWNFQATFQDSFDPQDFMRQ
jgi:hypothetical protein